MYVGFPVPHHDFFSVFVGIANSHESRHSERDIVGTVKRSIIRQYARLVQLKMFQVQH